MSLKPQLDPSPQSCKSLSAALGKSGKEVLVEKPIRKEEAQQNSPVKEAQILCPWKYEAELVWKMCEKPKLSLSPMRNARIFGCPRRQ